MEFIFVLLLHLLPITPGLVVALMLVMSYRNNPDSKEALRFVKILAVPVAAYNYFTFWWVWECNSSVLYPITLALLIISAAIMIHKNKDNTVLINTLILSIVTVAPLLTIILASVFSIATGNSVQYD